MPAGVFDRRKNGVIVSRRMERDENLSRKNRANGQKGGNPNLCYKTEIRHSDIRRWSVKFGLSYANGAQAVVCREQESLGPEKSGGHRR